MCRLKYDYIMLMTICNEGNVTLLENYKDKYITRDTRIIGKCILCENSFDKSLNKLYKQRNFGCLDCAKKIKFDKIKNTTMEKYGVEHAAQSKEIGEKIKTTNLEKYGFEYGLKNIEVKEKRKQTNLNKYGYENPLQRDEIKEKSRKTCLEKYGVKYAMQCPEIIEKNVKNSYYFKEYIFPSGNIIQIQGYENFALNELINKNIDEKDIITGCKNVPKIWYNDINGKMRRHFVDIFIPSQNKCIEVKSTWTFKKQKDTILLKQNAAKELGYLYEIWIYDNKGNKVDFYD